MCNNKWNHDKKWMCGIKLFLRGICNRLRGIKLIPLDSTYSWYSTVELQIDFKLHGMEMDVCGIIFVNVELCGIDCYDHVE